MKRIKRTSFLYVVILAWFILLTGCNNKKIEEVSIKKPNIIYVLADQLRAQSTGYSGDPNLIGKTPNLDKIADQGINFRNAISVTPVCTPYRATLLTGQYPTTTGMFLNDLHLPEESYTMAEMFKESNYQTAYIGKWHLDGMGRFAYTPPERRQGFDYWKALECSHEYSELYYYEGNDPKRKKWDGYGPYEETKDAVSYINDHANDSDPFLLFLSYGTPHFPYHNTPEDTKGLFNPEEIILRENVGEDYKEKAKKDAAGYYAHLYALDKCIGKLQKAIEDAGILENTIFVFTSDHGEMLGSHNWWPRQKQVSWAESVKVPFLLKYPAQFGNTKIEVDAPISTPDILPTLLDLSGLAIPETIEGESIAYAIGSEESGKEKAALVMSISPFAGNFEEYRGIYTSRYAYIKTLDGPFHLFDNIKDPYQMNNLVNNPEYSELQKQMENMLLEELKKIGDDFKDRQFYLDKWGYKLNKRGNIDYSEGATFQGPSLNKNLDL